MFRKTTSQVELFDFKIPKDTDSYRDLLTSIVAADNLTANSLNTNNNMDFVGFISRDPTFNNGNLVSYKSSDKDGNNVFIMTADGDAASCRTNDLYLLESATGTTQIAAMVTNVTDNKRIELAVNDPLKLNQRGNGSDENTSLLMTTPGGGTIKKLNIISYEITNDGTLVRKTYGNQPGANQIETRELIYGVKDFQIKYFMEDGTILDNPSNNQNGRENQQKMNNVVQLQVTITIIPNHTDNETVPAIPVTIREFISTRNLRYESS